MVIAGSMTSVVQEEGNAVKLGMQVMCVVIMAYGSSTRFVARGPLIRSKHKMYLWVRRIDQLVGYIYNKRIMG